MANVKLTVPIVLSRDAEGYRLEVESKNGNAATIHLNTMADPLTASIFLAWGVETMNAAFFAKRRKTSKKDVTGVEIAEGDIISRRYNEFYAYVTGVIKWDTDKAAFIAEGTFEGGGGWSTFNLEDAGNWHIIGDIFRTPGFLVPAKKKAA